MALIVFLLMFSGITANETRCRYLVENSVGIITAILGDAGINISDIRAPQVKNNGVARSLAVIKTDTEVSDELLEKMAASADAVIAFKFNC